MLAKVKGKWSTIQFDVFVLSFSSFQCPRKKVWEANVVHAIFHKHQTSGTCVGVCMCNRTH